VNGGGKTRVVENETPVAMMIMLRDLPQSTLGQAIDYALGQWPTLEVYLDDEACDRAQTIDALKRAMEFALLKDWTALSLW
jgi:hypothetical protein